MRRNFRHHNGDASVNIQLLQKALSHKVGLLHGKLDVHIYRLLYRSVNRDI